ncbi:cysteine desulfurase family protein [Mycolicibacterium fortuitum]|uniref:cysteine desulfurase family protein n=1 Tax=Mycolicibacterium fortuitum TaxID=1766 RepID=UPI00241FA004|nr:cysteine desulfurase family protein [Mycolicibacterium fortuitum]MDG5771669.1 cysteine desulfurase family protein [Mycolicibacterium fortuitum]MDG5782570.1 cysteine desulfurase family protein [Mycolicibacterium fortuitum]
MVYLDYNASTPVDQRILVAVTESQCAYGNPASAHHAIGKAAAERVEEARSRVADLVGRPAQDIVFTSGATEAAVLGLLGTMIGAAGRPNIVVSPTEHKAVLEAAELGARLAGGEARVVRVDRDGVVDLDDLARLVDNSVAAVAVMAANNETGVVASAAEIAEISHRAGSLFFVDATQLIGKGPADAAAALADLMVFSSHKIYGPKGAGALVASRRVQKSIVPIASGGGQERGLRGGTQNTPSIVGFGLAAELAMKEQASDAARIGDLADALLTGLQRQLPDVYVNGGEADRLPNTLNLRFVGADAEAVMASMPEICVSAGSACNSAVPSPSHVLLAMGMSGTEASESLRISLGRPTTRDEVDVAVACISAAVSRVRELTRE